ncbi:MULTISPECIES: 4-carboxymuconolactone decarboxylase [Acidocella]|uniref:4-carboxymuconolactone decarboxylase n=1 Tax=Acidocella TaxID=50709 RepID=UPI00028E6AE0|nr:MULTISPECIES: 4-carboxymuconolactone decarboxylase [Acidocella]EKM99840.1 4-carboxymuconolactone decarboxylase [Acidocella sp. MX-AZ02]MDE2239870.1 4-carboxymuconolactone decarboxylase [Rhodospirillales bacterium]WBO58469.1 4-carboxymuconolactone decarboxylase [Acidocella sp. MX-AZ03]
MPDPSPRYTQGMKTRRKVLSDKYVDVAVANTTPFNADFQELITEAAWGNVWSRGTIPLRERSMLTIALLAALGHHDEVAMHVRATANTGASMDDIKEALLHVAIYAGVPAANHAFKIAAQAYAEMAAPKEDRNA